jgi:PAS domain S-box-containing protein
MGNDSVDDRLTAAPCGFLSFAQDGAVTWTNETLVEMLGYERDELVGQHVERILTVGSRIFYQTHWFPLLRLHGRAEEIFLMLRAKDGEEIGVLVNAVRRERGQALEYDCVTMRVRERQKYEDELLRARRAADTAHHDVEIQRQELQRANELLQEQAAELEFQQQQLQEQAAELEAAGEELQAINDELLARTEEAEQFRAIADEANRAKSTFLAVMSHELRTPLNAIAGYAELLQLGIHGPVTDAQSQAIERITRSERYLLRLINEILNLARIEAGRVDYVIEAVPLGELMSALAPMVEPQLAQKGIEFVVEIPPDLVVLADREKAEQILLNLLSNASKFTPRGGRVTVDAATSIDAGDQLVINVRDTGIGIPADKLRNVFEPFVQVDASRTRNDEGSGLGLAISLDLAHGMNGDLTAESRVGEGSTFTLRLPKA